MRLGKAARARAAHVEDLAPILHVGELAATILAAEAQRIAVIKPLLVDEARELAAYAAGVVGSAGVTVAIARLGDVQRAESSTLAAFGRVLLGVRDAASWGRSLDWLIRKQRLDDRRGFCLWG